ncbi:inovirus-type Gp2 protein [Burkholderia sp. BE17]|uniref:inovirus-type Gp2 protein n=1 Tax=Burkholderia sp. BE17 TaxID=2656644 RepID=UPI00187B268E|nr:inovirus-type Gp2 protein [Burkholderia sp. BE17]
MMSQVFKMFGEFGFTGGALWDYTAPTGFVRYWEIGEYAELLRQLESFLDSVLETNQIPFDIRYQGGRQQAVRNPIGVPGYRNLSGFLPLCGQWLDVYWPGYVYSADLQLFFDCFMRHPLAQVYGYGGTVVIDQALAACLYNDFVGYLRMEAVRRGVRKWLSDWRGNLDDQEASVRRYLGTLQGLYRVLLPVRMDLYYAHYAADDCDAMQRLHWAVSEQGVWMPVSSNLSIGHGQPETRARFDAAAAMADRDRFFGNRRGADRVLFDSMVGHICKLEQGGRHRANHFHCVFFFDAARVTQAQLFELKYRIGERWRNVTNGQGLVYDCHQRSDRVQLMAQGKWAIDPVDCSQPVQMARLVEYLVGYFTKDEQGIRIKPTARARTLTMGRA